MAHVSERGQLILIMGLVLAVAFVVLVPLLNTVIFTENLAARGTSVGGDEAIETRATAIDGVAGILYEENNRSHADRASLSENVTTAIDAFGTQILDARIEYGLITELEDVDVDEGTELTQDTARNFTSNTHEPDWTFATNVNATREFTIDATNQSALEDTTDPKNESFQVIVSDGSDQWIFYVYVNNSATTLAVKNGSETDPTEDVCSPVSTPTIDLIEGTVDGSPCQAIEFAKGVTAPYDLRYEYANRTEGTYNITINGTDIGGFNAPESASSPYWEPIAYSVRFDVLYDTYELTYRTRVRAVPEAPA